MGDKTKGGKGDKTKGGKGDKTNPTRSSVGDKVMTRFGSAVVCGAGTRPDAGKEASTSCSLDLGWGRAYVRNPESFIGESGTACTTPFGRGVLVSGAINEGGFCQVQLPWGYVVVQAPQVQLRPPL